MNSWDTTLGGRLLDPGHLDVHVVFDSVYGEPRSWKRWERARSQYVQDFPHRHGPVHIETLQIVQLRAQVERALVPGLRPGLYLALKNLRKGLGEQLKGRLLHLSVQVLGRHIRRQLDLPLCQYGPRIHAVVHQVQGNAGGRSVQYRPDVGVAPAAPGQQGPVHVDHAHGEQVQHRLLQDVAVVGADPDVRAGVADPLDPRRGVDLVEVHQPGTGRYRRQRR